MINFSKTTSAYKNPATPQNISIIGSTGSIGRQTLEVIASHRPQFKVFALACHKNVELLFEQIQKFQPQVVAVYKKSAAKKLAQICALRGFSISPKRGSARRVPPLSQGRGRLSPGTPIANFKIPKILFGAQSWEQISAHPKTDKIVFASNGTAAYPALLKAIKFHKKITLANKEIIVAHGAKIMRLASRHKVTIVPIDSEHSAIFQCIQGEDPRNIEKVILTCSGGPFYGKDKNELAQATVKQALAHPTWKMGEKISIDSATLMNKGFEIIEAMHFFGLKEDQVEILIHPESVVHSMVQFKDGSIKAQMGTPDMRLPIAYALAWPNRPATNFPRLDFSKLNQLTFLQPDFTTFEGPTIARLAFREGGRLCSALTKANDRVVEDFLKNKISFDQIYPQIKSTLKIIS